MLPEIIGHKKIISFLERVQENGCLSHAYLLIGQPNLGKTTVVEWLTKKLLGEQGLHHPDAYVVSRLEDEKTGKIKSEISVEQIRLLRERLLMSGLAGGYKIIFIEEADVLNTEAANALLKTLEEPTAKTILLLRASSLSRLPATIVSRCQILRFSPVPSQEILEALVKRGVIRSEAEKITVLSNGCPGYALRLLRDEETRSLEEMSVKQFVDMVKATASTRLISVTAWLPKDEVNRSERLKELLDRWEQLLRVLLLTSSEINELSAYLTVYPELEKLAQQKTSEHWIRVLEKLREVRNDLSFHVNPVLAMERLVLSF